MYTLRITTHVYRESNADADSAANEVIDNYLASPTFPTITIDENWHQTDLSAHDGVSWNVSTNARDSPSSPGLVVFRGPDHHECSVDDFEGDVLMDFVIGDAGRIPLDS